MNVSEFLESNFLTAKYIQSSPSKKGVILSPGTEEIFQGTKGLKVLVEIDGKQKFWKINQSNLKILADKYGIESDLYVGKVINFNVVTVNGQNRILIQV